MTEEEALAAMAKWVKQMSVASSEGKYADAYQRLVQLGVRPQLRRKYR